MTTRQVADLLGVKTQTVYAYASRGLLTSEPAPSGRGSTFDARQVETLAGRRSRGRPRPADPAEEQLTAHTGITLSERGRLFYRGRDAVELSTRQSFEAVVGWLWNLGRGTGDGPDGSPDDARAVELRAPGEVVAAVTRTGATLPAHVRLNDRLRVAVAVAASADPLRFDLRRENVLARGAAVMSVMVESLPLLGTRPAAAPPDGSLAQRLWPRLAPGPGGADAVACLEQALVLLADHGLAASTTAARVAASARANPYAVVSAGLGALDGPLHGAASGLAYRLLTDVLASGNAIGVVSDHLRSGLPIPGVGIRQYPDGDPRARALLESTRGLPGADETVAAVDAVVRAAAGNGEAHANIDLALAAFTLLTGMPAEAGEVIFAVARTAGWIAHALEEYQEPALRLRPHDVYTGPRPAF
ncbi:citrate synthase [Pseudofrankia asymbiotica]|uniref:citrate synthase (unknown stereospecificity) n=1 Tax=Pseudofrankia asymbiotica TaxID=1834516 RepID=A0A1V2I3X4_9ACTN|nr:citrate synthase [Pseudofrankia asymbiotica]